MSECRKRPLDSSSDSGSSCGETSKRRAVQKKTVQEWISQYDKQFNTAVWLKFDTVDRTHVSTLRCSVCSQFQKQLESLRNFRPAFIEGTTNVRLSTVKDHAGTDMHARAMLLYKKQRSSSVCEYAPIARSLSRSSMDASTRDKTKRKFDVAYLIAKEKLPFTKMASICELEERHGVGLGTGYKNDRACATFIDFIGRDLQNALLSELSKRKFFSVQADATTDAGNVEVELYLALHFDPFSTDGKVHVRNTFLSARYLKSGTGKGLYESFERAMQYMDIDNWKTKMIGFGCDGASANIAEGGLRGILTREVPWIFMFWCLAHRLELSVKDALQSTFFGTIDDVLLRLYYIYNKSPKKCHQLQDIITELKSCLEPSEMPIQGGSCPLRACGTRFVTHKVAALERVVDRFGAYLSHMIAMTEDTSLKPVDRQKVKGYVLKWQDSKILLGCALFHDLLRPCSILCKVLQEEEICVVRAIEAVMKTKKSLEKIKTTPFEDLPSVKKALGRIKHEEDGSVTYQGVELTYYDRARTYLELHKDEYVEALETCVRNRIQTQDTDLLTHAVTILATKGWERSESASFGHVALDAICQRFQIPLEAASVDCSAIQEEWDDMVDYGRKYLNLVQEDYKVLWWKLFNAVDSEQWRNVLSVVELLFCLPMSNGHLEQVFSQLKLIKVNRRTCLGEDTLDRLIRISVQGPSLAKWDASYALELWEKDKVRRVNRKDTQTQSRCGSASVSSTSTSTETSDEVDHFTLDDWEEWIESLTS